MPRRREPISKGALVRLAMQLLSVTLQRGPDWAEHLAGAGCTFVLRCWIGSASAYVLMGCVYGALLAAVLVVW